MLERCAVLALSWSMVFSAGCGKDTSVNTLSQPTAPRAGKPSAKAAFNQRMVVVVNVRKDGRPLSGVRLSLTRSISGHPTDYRWGGVTDKEGRIEIQVLEETTKSVSGYYGARAEDIQTGDMLEYWGSIPLNGGLRQEVHLEAGEPAEVVSSEALSNTEPVPIVINAIEAIDNLFDEYDVVVLGEGRHELENSTQFVLSVLRTPEVRTKIDDVVLEFVNPIHQNLLDRYVLTDANIPRFEIDKVWQDAFGVGQGGGLAQQFYQDFIPNIREINQSLPTSERLRVLGGNPAFDWSLQDQLSKEAFLQIYWQTQFQLGATSFIERLDTEVLARGRKALVFLGDFHLQGIERGLNRKYPGSTIAIKHTYSAGTNNAEAGQRLENVATPPAILFPNGGWMATLDASLLWPQTENVILDPNGSGQRFSPGTGKRWDEEFQAFLYLGPDAEMSIPPQVIDDVYAAILAKRQEVIPRIAPPPEGGYPVDWTLEDIRDWQRQNGGTLFGPGGSPGTGAGGGFTGPGGGFSGPGGPLPPDGLPPDTGGFPGYSPVGNTGPGTGDTTFGGG